jgi:hypothetical protein
MVAVLALVPLPGEACHGAGEFGFCLNTDACTRVVCRLLLFKLCGLLLEILHEYSLCSIAFGPSLEAPFLVSRVAGRILAFVSRQESWGLSQL